MNDRHFHAGVQDPLSEAASNKTEPKRLTKRGILEAHINERRMEEPASARVHLLGSDGKYYYPQGCVPYEKDNHFTVEGHFEVELPAGEASVLIEKGKEYRSIFSKVTVKDGETVRVNFVLERWIHMASRGWYSGDLHVHRPLKHMPHLMHAEDLNVAPIITDWNKRNLWNGREIPENKVVAVDAEHAYGILAQEDERGGGAVVMMNLEEPINLKPFSRWYPTNFAYCQEARKQEAVIDQEKPFWWEAPVNIALGGIDTIGILNNHMTREEIIDKEAWGRPRDREKYSGNEGFILHVFDLYYHYLNLGLRIPISAGSASGVLKNPIGYNRLYVHLKDNFSYERWFQGMKDGRAFATNGPMLFFSIDGCELFSTLKTNGKPFRGRAHLSVLSQSALDRAEIIFNSRVIRRFEAGNQKKQLEKEFELTLNESGWIAARVFEKSEKTVRVAHTNPFFIEVDDPMKPNPESARFLAEWCRQLLFQSRQVSQRYETEDQRREVEDTYKKAIEFYEQLLSK